MSNYVKLSKKEKAAAVMRLKSQEERQRIDFRAGIYDGRMWTIYRGDRRLLEALELMDMGGIEDECPAESDRQKVLAGFLAHHYGEQGGNPLDIDCLLASVFPPGSPHNAEYVDGFQLGATMAWDEIKHLLKAGAGSEGAGAA